MLSFNISLFTPMLCLPVLLNLLLQCTSCHWIVFTPLSVKLTYNTNNRFDYFQQCSTVRYLLSTVDELRYRLGCMRKIVSKLSLWVNFTLVRYIRKEYLSKLSLWVNCTLVRYSWKEYLGKLSLWVNCTLSEIDERQFK